MIVFCWGRRSVQMSWLSSWLRLGEKEPSDARNCGWNQSSDENRWHEIPATREVSTTYSDTQPSISSYALVRRPAELSGGLDRSGSRQRSFEWCIGTLTRSARVGI